MVGEDLQLVVREGDRQEALEAAGAGRRRVAGAAAGERRAGAPGGGRAMVAVGDVERRHRGEGGDQRVALGRGDPPEGVGDAVGGDEVEERRLARRRARPRRRSPARPVGEEHDAGLRAQLDDVPGAIVLLVAPRLLVLLDQVALVLVDREAAGDADLDVTVHVQPIEVERRLGLDRERRLAA